MRLAVTHKIVLKPATPARSAIAAFRLFPRDCDTQNVSDWRVDFDRDCSFRQHDDAYGNDRRTLNTDGPIETLTIFSRGIATTENAHAIVSGTQEPLPLDLFLRQSQGGAALSALMSFARERVAGASDSLDKAHKLMRAIHENFTLTPSDAQSQDAAWMERKGSIKDLASLLTIAARMSDLPARIVAGYLCDPLASTAQAHLWSEIHVGALGWIGFDPSLRLCAHEGHVRMAAGLDYSDVEPLRIVFYGASDFERIESIAIKDLTQPIEPMPISQQSQSQYSRRD